MDVREKEMSPDEIGDKFGKMDKALAKVIALLKKNTGEEREAISIALGAAVTITQKTGQEVFFLAALCKVIHAFKAKLEGKGENS